ncbi:MULTISPECIES: prolyl oligopeptidase family serine peptidase [Bacillaceae]|uniref:alpha/beta hydrolase family protein n=1 Tax=Bacillaceae TaxID=186817 RepID=UPI0010533DDD|nr:prolyl oligopeptidase family serine peptidase [Bacillus sp. CBEL-1]TDB51116.1 S9 family peptidase [Bacillus sp. CBEL-1]USY54792.1 prolyl oligopeptidase family serine peptidase [Bacillus sp. 1780r2a1]
MKDGTIISQYPFPSPNPRISLSIVTYMCQGLKIKGMLAEPKEEGTYDGFLYLRGGIKNIGTVRPGRLIQFASQGFIVMAPFYRGNQGGEGNEDFGGDDRYDAFAAYDLLVSHPRVHQNRIHVFGFSRGGVMALFTAIEKSAACSLVLWGGVTDMVLTYEERTDLRRMMKRVIGGTPSKYPDRYEWRSPLAHAHNLNVPVLLIHGKEDANVSIEHAYQLEKMLKEHRKPVESWYFDEFPHAFPPKQNRETVKNLTEWMKTK